MASNAILSFCRRAAVLSTRRSKILTPSSSCSSWSAPRESSEDFKYVERLLPKGVVPEPPKHESYPTPSGWVPATAKLGDYPYFVRRTRYHQMPVYLEIKNGGNRHLTTIRLVDGDIWAFEKDLNLYLENLEGKKVYTAVDELCCKVRVRGAKMQEVADFLLGKGF